MKKLSKVLLLLSLFIIILSGSVFAESKDFIVTKELEYQNKRKVMLSSGFVEVLVGNTNFVQYQEDKQIKITPMPDEMREDEFGNMYAYFDLTRIITKSKI